MILNNKIWRQTVAAAIVAVTGKREWLRAIERAVIEIEHAKYWSFADGVLTLKSTSSGKLYRVDDAHTCEAIEQGHKACKHRAARQLMLRYSERLALSEISCEGHKLVETASLRTMPQRVTVKGAQPKSEHAYPSLRELSKRLRKEYPRVCPLPENMGTWRTVGGQEVE